MRVDSEGSQYWAGAFSNTVKYAKFLELKLQPWMVFPCDENGLLLFHKDGLDGIEIEGVSRLAESEVEFQKAKDKVIFEGFELRPCMINDITSEPFIGVVLNGQWCGGWGNFIDTRLRGVSTLESLTKMNGTCIPPTIKRIIFKTT